MEIKYIKDIDVLNIELKEGEFQYSQELGEGIILDLSEDGEILGIEIIDASKRLGQDIAAKIADKYLATA